MAQTIVKVKNLLFSPIDISILVYFRIIFGTIMLWEVLRYFEHDWISSYWIKPTFFFTYYGFDWVRPWPGDLMYVHFIGLGVLSICILIGFKYRICTTLFFLGFTYMFLLEESRYLNHFYLIIWISFLMIFLPANRSFSIDALRKPIIKTKNVWAWSLWLLRAQIGIVYFFGGIAKVNSDWFRGEPMRMWLQQRTDFPILGEFFSQEWMVYSLTYGSFLLDLLIIPFLLWKKSRWPAFGLITIFHIMNDQLFSIGIFPWFMIFATLLFFSPNWPRRLFYLFRKIKDQTPISYTNPNDKEKTKKIIIVLFLSFLIIQSAIPLRHHFYPGEVSWTEEGHNFSWHMKLRDKDVYYLKFYATDFKTGETWEVDPLDDLSKRQFNKMSTRPDMILQYAHHISDKLQDIGYEQIEVRVEALVSLNGREPQLLIDPSVDLASQPLTLPPKPWIMHLNEN
jgi:vitamin K-dependent gamma-carboxylase